MNRNPKVQACHATCRDKEAVRWEEDTRERKQEAESLLLAGRSSFELCQATCRQKEAARREEDMRKREQEARADAARKATYAAALEREAVRVASIQASCTGYS